MGRQKNPRPLEGWTSHQKGTSETELRIVGGQLGGRKIRYSGDPRTRPMKDVTREAIYNLVGGFVPDKWVVDLFAGSGAVGIEALSRGAFHACFVERHFPTARLIRENLADLGLTEVADVESADALFWLRQWLKQPPLDHPWCVFFCPPYALFKQKSAELQMAIHGVIEAAPEESVIVVEAPESLPESWFPRADAWRFRHYPPALVGVWRPSAFPYDDRNEQAWD